MMQDNGKEKDDAVPVKERMLHGKRRNRRGEAARDALLAATITCLNRVGYAATSVEEVMAESGLGRGSVLNQFPNRLMLMGAVANKAMGDMVEHARTILAVVDDPRKRLFALADAAWETHNLPEAIAVTEILLASRWDRELAAELRAGIETVERSIDRLNGGLARDAGVNAVHRFLVYARLLNSNFRGLTIELMVNGNRAMILGAVEAQKKAHVQFCRELLDLAQS